MVVDFSLDEIDKAAGLLLTAGKGRTVFALHGDMGAGKTTLVHAVCRHLNINDTVSSPTFSIINEYLIPSTQQVIYHMDWYRLKSEEDAIQAGVLDILESGNLCFIEWPSIAEGLLPENCVRVSLEFISENERKISTSLF